MSNNQGISVLLVNHYANLGGGAEQVLLNLASGLQARGFHVIALLPQSGDVEVALSKKRIPCYFAPIEVKSWRGWFSFLLNYAKKFLKIRSEVLKLFHHHHVSMIYANGHYAAAFMLPISIFFQKPLIWHAHGFLAENTRNKFLLWVLSERTKHVIAISESVKRDLVHRGFDSDKITVVYNGISQNITYLNRLGNDIRQELKLDIKSRLIISVGQIIPRKRQEDLIKAISLVSIWYPKSHLLIVGDSLCESGDIYKTYLVNMVSDLNIEAKVHFLGYRSDVQYLFSQSNIAVLCSEQEPFGLVILEAMDAGVPVIATNVDGLNEFVKNDINGVLVSAYSPTELANAIKVLFEKDSLRESLIVGGHHTVESFTLDRQIDAIAEICRNLTRFRV